jgi:hypothetical protein
MGVHITTSTLIQTQDMTIITDARTYRIQMKRILPFRDIQGISSATVIDVTPQFIFCSEGGHMQLSVI